MHGSEDLESDIAITGGRERLRILMGMRCVRLVKMTSVFINM